MRPSPKTFAGILALIAIAAACTDPAGSTDGTAPVAPSSPSAPPDAPSAAPRDHSGGELRARLIEGVEPAKNIVVIVTDDQRWDSLWVMSRVQEQLMAPGVTFENAYVSNPLCCPSRASILTGRYSQRTGVYTNLPPDGGYAAFDPTPSIATILHRTGYRTALIGKYLNGYTTRTIPPGWDRWFAFATGDANADYVDYVVNDDGRLRRFGSTRPDYSLDVLTREAVRTIRTADRPLFLYLAVPAPHGPAIPAPRYAEGFLSGLQPHRPPNFNEEDVRDKPQWVRRLPLLRDDGYIQRIEDRQRSHLSTLLSVDESIGDVIDALDAEGELQDSVIVFLSDNGLLWGEHRNTSKYAPFEEAVRIPMVIRWDAIAAADTRIEELAMNIDLAPTLAEAAGLRLLGTDGRSLAPLVRGEPVDLREDFLLEHVGARNQHPYVPTYCGVHGRRWVFVRYVTGEEELYDLERDPYQLENLAEAPGRPRRVRGAMRRRLAELCDPPPPGMELPRSWGQASS